MPGPPVEADNRGVVSEGRLAVVDDGPGDAAHGLGRQHVPRGRDEVAETFVAELVSVGRGCLDDPIADQEDAIAAPRFRVRMIWERISAMAAMSRPTQGFAATSTSTSPESSRASTMRWTLPPDRLLAGESGDEALTR